MKTFREVYKLPFHNRPIVDTWVLDSGGNFCFQFENSRNELNEMLLAAINSESYLKNNELRFNHNEGEIKDNIGNHWITIRGWGNLTSPNCLGFSPEEASYIQDTLAEFIVHQLNFRISMKNVITEVKHSNSKFAWNVINTVLGGKRKIAVVPYVAIDIDNEDDPMRKEAFEIAQFISDSFNKDKSK